MRPRSMSLLLLLATASSASAAPSSGRYDAQLCVATRPGAEPGCGAAEADVRAGGRVDVRVADVVYKLALRSSRLDVATFHGALQIDEFSSPFEWDKTVAGEVLRFGDEAKSVRYEVRLGARRPR